MKAWLENREEKWDAYHQNDVLCGRGITDMVTKVVTATEGGQRERQKRKADTDGAGLKASIHTDATQTGGPEKPEERHQSQPGRQLKPKPKPKPNPAPTPTPRTTSTPIAGTTPVPTHARRWKTVPQRNQKKPASPAPVPTTGSSLADRCIILRRDEKVPLPNKMDQEIASAINRALFHQQAPAHIRIMNTRRKAKCAITTIMHENATAEMAQQYRYIIITGARTVD
jgi:outer membrane biosynthesis protein TonB